MRILVITSTGYRHKYLSSKICEIFKTTPTIIEVEKNEKHFSNVNGKIFLRHFSSYTEVEKQFFDKFIALKSSIISREKINDVSFVRSVMSQGFDYIFVFGSPILKKPWFDLTQNVKKINFHLGLSPYYIGSGTLFWPFYNNDIIHAGVTVHHLTEKLDSGLPIIKFKFQNASGDYYQLVNMLVKYSIDKGLQYIFENHEAKMENKKINLPLEGVKSKIYKNIDLNEEAITYVLRKYNKNIRLKYDIVAC